MSYVNAKSDISLTVAVATCHIVNITMLYCTELSWKSTVLQNQNMSVLIKHYHVWLSEAEWSVSKLTSIGSDNGLGSGRCQAIFWTNTGVLLIRTLGTNLSEILSGIHAFLFKKMHVKMWPAKWQPFCLSLNALSSPLQQHWKQSWASSIIKMIVLICFHSESLVHHFTMWNSIQNTWNEILSNHKPSNKEDQETKILWSTFQILLILIDIPKKFILCGPTDNNPGLV